MHPSNYSEEATALGTIGRNFGERGWCRATSGNYSARVDDTHCLITRSGSDKSSLTTEDFLICDLTGNPVDPSGKPSAETLIHTQLYRLDASIGVVLHTHSACSTLLSMHSGATITFKGFEMQKALSGVQSHEERITFQIFDNDQNVARLANAIAAAWKDKQILLPGFLIRGHGVYAWGEDVQGARRHLEGLEFLCECRWREQVLQRP